MSTLKPEDRALSELEKALIAKVSSWRMEAAVWADEPVRLNLFSRCASELEQIVRPLIDAKLSARSEGDVSRWAALKPGDVRTLDGKLCRFVEMDDRGEVWEVLAEGKAEEIARVIDPEAFEDVEGAIEWCRVNRPERNGWELLAFCRRSLGMVQDAYSKANRIISILTGEGE